MLTDITTFFLQHSCTSLKLRKMPMILFDLNTIIRNRVMCKIMLFGTLVMPRKKSEEQRKPRSKFKSHLKQKTVKALNSILL